MYANLKAENHLIEKTVFCTRKWFVQNVLQLLVQLREQRLERETNLLESQRSWLDNELQRTSDDLAKLRREHAQQGLELRGKLDSLTQEVKVPWFLDLPFECCRVLVH